jgi:hypothetical protein
VSLPNGEALESGLVPLLHPARTRFSIPKLQTERERERERERDVYTYIHIIVHTCIHTYIHTMIGAAHTRPEPVTSRVDTLSHASRARVIERRGEAGRVDDVYETAMHKDRDTSDTVIVCLLLT